MRPILSFVNDSLNAVFGCCCLCSTTLSEGSLGGGQKRELLMNRRARVKPGGSRKDERGEEVTPHCRSQEFIAIARLWLPYAERQQSDGRFASAPGEHDAVLVRCRRTMGRLEKNRTRTEASPTTEQTPYAGAAINAALFSSLPIFNFHDLVVWCLSGQHDGSRH